VAYQVFLEERTKMRIPSPSFIPKCWGGARWALRYLLASLAVAILFNFGSPTGAMAQTYRGKVVVAETGQPLEGAVFVIVWHTKPFIAMDGPSYFHSAKEALTDAKGEFFVDGSPGIDWNPFTYIVKSPSIAIYMPSYGPFPVGHVKETPHDEMIKAMTGAGVVVKLPKLKSQQEMRRYTGPGDLQILSTTPYEEMPNLIRLINIHRKLAGLVSQYETPSR
jgi:hypothetical protein